MVYSGGMNSNKKMSKCSNLPAESFVAAVNMSFSSSAVQQPFLLPYFDLPGHIHINSTVNKYGTDTYQRLVNKYKHGFRANT